MTSWRGGGITLADSNQSSDSVVAGVLVARTVQLGARQAMLVTTVKIGRVRTCKLGPRSLEEEAAWIESYRRRWGTRFDALDKVVEELKRKEAVDGRKERK